MSRAVIWQDIYNFIVTDAALMALLGPVTPDNLRALRSYPQFESMLSDYEPSPDEGWLVIDEPQPYPSAYNRQLETIYEVIDVAVSGFATRFSLIDDVIDRLDSFFNWSVAQQRDLSFGERIVLMTRRQFVADSYDAKVKLFRKDIRYVMTLVLEEQPA